MAAPPVKPPLHNFPVTFLQWNTKKHRPSPPPPSQQSPSSPPQFPVGSRSSRNRRPSTPLRQPEPEPEPEPEQEPEQIEKQWNFRPRRGINASVPASGSGGGGTTVVDAVEREKRKLWISLSRDEIEEDIYSLTGSKPSRRPRKRAKIVQKQVDNVFPGLWLVGVAPESYRNFDPPPKK